MEPDSVPVVFGQTGSRGVGAQYGGQPEREPCVRKPLEEIADMADDLGRMNITLAQFLSRVNGPTPSPIAKGDNARPPSYYVGEIERLRATLRETGEFVDAVNRLG